MSLLHAKRTECIRGSISNGIIATMLCCVIASLVAAQESLVAAQDNAASKNELELYEVHLGSPLNGGTDKTSW